MLSQIGDGQLRSVELSAYRKNAQLDFGCTEVAGGETVEAKLKEITADEVLSHARQPQLSCSPRRSQGLFVYGFVIDDPNTGAGESRILRPHLRKGEIDSAVEAKFA